MTESLHAFIACRGQVIRWDVARPATVARHLARLDTLEGCVVGIQQWYGKPQLLTAEEFLQRYAH